MALMLCVGVGMCATVAVYPQRAWYDEPRLPGFESHAVKGLRFVTASKGRVEFRMVVTKDHINYVGTLHGGCIATLVDVVGSAAILSVSITNLRAQEPQERCTTLCERARACVRVSGWMLPCATLITVTCVCLYVLTLTTNTEQMGPVKHVSTDINTTYIAGTNPGEEVVIIGRCSKAGGRLAFSDVDLFKVVKKGGRGEEEQRELVAQGRHTKYIFRGNKGPRSRL